MVIHSQGLRASLETKPVFNARVYLSPNNFSLTKATISGVTYSGGEMRNWRRPFRHLTEVSRHGASDVFLSCRMTALARPRNSCADFLKSVVAGSRTVR